MSEVYSKMIKEIINLVNIEDSKKIFNDENRDHTLEFFMLIDNHFAIDLKTDNSKTDLENALKILNLNTAKLYKSVQNFKAVDLFTKKITKPVDEAEEAVKEMHDQITKYKSFIEQYVDGSSSIYLKPIKKTNRKILILTIVFGIISLLSLIINIPIAMDFFSNKEPTIINSDIKPLDEFFKNRDRIKSIFNMEKDEIIELTDSSNLPETLVIENDLLTDYRMDNLSHVLRVSSFSMKVYSIAQKILEEGVEEDYIPRILNDPAFYEIIEKRYKDKDENTSDIFNIYAIIIPIKLVYRTSNYSEINLGIRKSAEVLTKNYNIQGTLRNDLVKLYESWFIQIEDNETKDTVLKYFSNTNRKIERGDLLYLRN